MTLGAVLAAGACAILFSLVCSIRAPRCWLFAVLAGTITALAAAAWMLATGEAWEFRSAFLIGGEQVHLRLDGVSALFLALVAVVALTSSVMAADRPASADEARITAGAASRAIARSRASIRSCGSMPVRPVRGGYAETAIVQARNAPKNAGMNESPGGHRMRARAPGRRHCPSPGSARHGRGRGGTSSTTRASRARPRAGR